MNQESQENKDYTRILTSSYKVLFTSVDKLFDASSVVDEVCALLDWVLALYPLCSRLCDVVLHGLPRVPDAAPAGSNNNNNNNNY